MIHKIGLYIYVFINPNCWILIYVFKYEDSVCIVLIYIFAFINNEDCKCAFEFSNPYSLLKILKNVKTELRHRQIAEKLHFSRILDERPNGWKYASFEGVKNAQIPWFYRQMRLKKASQKDAVFGNSRVKKTRF